jgi:flagellar protein FliJ
VKKFSLKRLLELRASHEEQVAAQLARANHEARQADAACDAIVTARHSGGTQLADVARAGATVGELRTLSSVLDCADVRLAEARVMAQAASEHAEQAQELHNVAARERRVLDRLYERHLEMVRLNTAAQDRQAMDAVALTRFTHDEPVARTGTERR